MASAPPMRMAHEGFPRQVLPWMMFEAELWTPTLAWMLESRKLLSTVFWSDSYRPTPPPQRWTVMFETVHPVERYTKMPVSIEKSSTVPLVIVTLDT